MPWTPTLLRRDKVQGRLLIEVSYTDGVDTIVERDYLDNPSNRRIKHFVRQTVKRLNNTESEIIDIPIGASIDITEDPITPPTPPTQNQLDRRAWFDDWEKLKQMNLLFENIPSIATPARVAARDAIQVSLKADWKNAYMGSIS